ncbi:dTDP-4-dehydrorhamnose 3,5-epimerase [Lutimonas halocynthiae]|uniref:dTDP-4-dehydrorhamnose 3,5-epimerase n=1 Tax=Lutimonas halocynthiae TaxID=1446477 RepID=UPI0025B51D1B|nr:dTDP-4-dehydrorhamnose 3,5-epimerase [Lutimonas halocynthiae]MDN3643375.1 dTDP-4-dehydrorhamnose 3,5-epimerase [Lutimonas halocynthiae]
MKFTALELEGAFVIEVDKMEDQRGFFGRLWCEKEFKDHNLNTNIVQSNVSLSKKKGTLRGMHFQRGSHAETKFVRCTRGSVYDVIVDLRPDSPTYKRWCGVELTADNYKMIYVPENFAHGFLTLEDNSEVYYMVTQFYSAEHEGGLHYNDSDINIEWPIEINEISDKDDKHPKFI